MKTITEDSLSGMLSDDAVSEILKFAALEDDHTVAIDDGDYLISFTVAPQGGQSVHFIDKLVHKDGSPDIVATDEIMPDSDPQSMISWRLQQTGIL